MRGGWIVMSLLLYCISETIFVSAQTVTLPQRTSYVVYRTKEKMTIDGKAEERSWSLAPWTNWFQDIKGGKENTPRFRTRAKMLWDDDHIYLLAVLEEPELWATVTQRDAVIFHDNDFEVFIDPDADTHNYYEIEMNALNTVWDLLLARPYRDGVRPLTSWDLAGLQTAVSLQGTLNDPGDKDTSWTVEISIPFRGLSEYGGGGRPRNGDHWRLDFSRVEWKTKITNGKYDKETDPATGRPYREDDWVWSPIGAIDMHRPEHWGFVQFTDTLAGQNIQPFISDPEDEVKDELRSLYYAQREYTKQKGYYASSIHEMKKSGMINYSLAFNPQLKSTFSMYEIIASRRNSSWLWHIDQSGRVWRTDRK